MRREYDTLCHALRGALWPPPTNLTAAVQALPAPGERPSPWETWALVGLVRHRQRQLWVGEVVANRLHGSLPEIAHPFVEGEAVRIHLMGERHWQIRMTGKGWKKSLHGPGAGFMEVDQELLEDTRRLQRHFGLEMLSTDYIITGEGSKHLLEVNHIPNVTGFPEIRAAYLDWAARWAR